MSNTIRRPVQRWYSKESRENRRVHYRAYRHRTNRQVRMGVEPIDRFRRTCGYLTW